MRQCEFKPGDHVRLTGYTKTRLIMPDPEMVFDVIDVSTITMSMSGNEYPLYFLYENHPQRYDKMRNKYQIH